jgi:hypothetical protein
MIDPIRRNILTTGTAAAVTAAAPQVFAQQGKENPKMNAVRHPDGEPWQWPEPTWRRITSRARAGRSLRPATWPGSARCAIALSFDADHDIYYPAA